MKKLPTSLIVLLIVANFVCEPFAATRAFSASGPTVKSPAAKVPVYGKAEWEKTLLEAKREGKVVVYAPAYSAITRAITTKFRKDFPGIALEYTPIHSGQAVPKIRAENAANLQISDIIVGGPGPLVTGLRDFVLPIEQFLILPEVKDNKHWLNGQLEFADNEKKLFLVFLSTLRSTIAYNSDLVKDPDQFASLWELTKPEWKGKVVFYDPFVGSGNGMSVSNFIYNHPDLGPNFFKAFVKVEPILVRDGRLMTEWIARGKYPLLLGPPAVEVGDMASKGAPIKFVEKFNEGTWYSAGSGTVAYLNKAPHPNAAKIFLNWLLTKETQATWSEASEDVSRRLDVTNDNIASYKVPRPGIRYWADFKEDAVNKRLETLKFLKGLWGK